MDPLGPPMLMLDGNMTLTGDIELADAGQSSLSGTGAITDGYLVSGGSSVTFAGSIKHGAFSLLTGTMANNSTGAGSTVFTGGDTLTLSGNNTAMDDRVMV